MLRKNLRLASFNQSSLDFNHTLNFYLQLHLVNKILLKIKVGESLDWGDWVTEGEDEEPGGFEDPPEEVRPRWRWDPASLTPRGQRAPRGSLAGTALTSAPSFSTFL